MPFDGQNFDTKPDLSDLMDDEILRTLVEADEYWASPDQWVWGLLDDKEGTQHCLWGAIKHVAGGSFDRSHDMLCFVAQANGIDTTSAITVSNEEGFHAAKRLLANAIAARARALRGA